MWKYSRSALAAEFGTIFPICAFLMIQTMDISWEFCIYKSMEMPHNWRDASFKKLTVASSCEVFLLKRMPTGKITLYILYPKTFTWTRKMKSYGAKGKRLVSSFLFVLGKCQQPGHLHSCLLIFTEV